LTKVEKLEERVDKIAHTGNWDDNLTTAEANSVRAFWIQLHWTSAEAEEYAAAERRQDEIRVAAGSVYFNTEQNREYNALATRQVELIHVDRSLPQPQHPAGEGLTAPGESQVSTLPA